MSNLPDLTLSVDVLSTAPSISESINPDIIVIPDTQPTSTTSTNNMTADPLGVSSSTPTTRKRTRKSQVKDETPKKPKILQEEEDDGSICPICLDNFESDGAHRLVALKCGHLFGESCIKRCLIESLKSCPSCRKRASKNDIRHIYAKKVTTIDTTEVNRYKKLYEAEQISNKKCKEENESLRFQLKLKADMILRLEQEIVKLEKTNVNLSNPVETTKSRTYKLFMEKNIEISKDGGCKMMIHGNRVKMLLVTQKSNQTLFPGFGIRFLDATTFRPSNEFFRTSATQLRDLSLDDEEELLLTTSQDKGAKMFNLQQRRLVTTFSPNDQYFWAAAFDNQRSNHVYLGAQRGGSTFIYDTRNPHTFVEEVKAEDDISPIIKICPVGVREEFPFGGFFVCKFNSVWFYEFDSSYQTIGTKLNVEGPFISMSYDDTNKHIVITARPTYQNKKSRFIIAQLVKHEDITNILILGTLLGSTVQSSMRRTAQIRVDDKNSIVAAYLEDSKSLCTWTAPNCSKLSSATLSDPVVDLCPIYSTVNTYLTALSDNKCRIYKLEVTET